MEISALRNIGDISAGWLQSVGICTADDLREVGVVEAYKRVRDAGFNPTENLLWAMAGALEDLDFRDIPEEMKEQLKSQISV